MHFLCSACQEVLSAEPGQKVECPSCRTGNQAPESALASGAVFGDFTIVREISRGGMGIVYLARQISLDRPVALKILQESFAADAQFVRDFVREARSAAKICHPNIVQAYAVGEDQGVYYFAMELINGETMKDVLKREHKIAPALAAEIVANVADALDFAWTEQKIVHQDVKPDNIMLTEHGRVKLADLGLSCVVSGNKDLVSSDDAEIMGTPQYISPERLTGMPTDIRSDLYSLGATFYQFVTGEFPYKGKNDDEIARQHVEGTLIPPIEKLPELPGELNRIILKMMEKNPEARYQSGSELVADLREFLKTMPGSLPMPKSAPLQKLARNNKDEGIAENSGGTHHRFPRFAAATGILLIAAALSVAGVFAYRKGVFASNEGVFAKFLKLIKKENPPEQEMAQAPSPAKTTGEEEINPADQSLYPASPPPVQTRPEFLAEAARLMEFLTLEDRESVLTGTDAFLQKYRKAETAEEQKKLDALLKAVAPMDETMRMMPFRNAKHAKQLEKIRAVKEARRKQEEQARRIAEAARLRQQEELRRKQAREEEQRKKREDYARLWRQKYRRFFTVLLWSFEKNDPQALDRAMQGINLSDVRLSPDAPAQERQIADQWKNRILHLNREFQMLTQLKKCVENPETLKNIQLEVNQNITTFVRFEYPSKVITRAMSGREFSVNLRKQHPRQIFLSRLIKCEKISVLYAHVPDADRLSMLSEHLDIVLQDYPHLLENPDIPAEYRVLFPRALEQYFKRQLSWGNEHDKALLQKRYGSMEEFRKAASK